MSKSILDRVSIGSSCQTDWEAMNGDHSQRYCDQCEKSVYNFSQLTRSQAEALIARTNRKLCARIERRPDGSILTADKSYSLPRFNQKFLRIASATMSAALSLAPVIAAKPVKNLPVLNFSQEQKDKKEQPPQDQDRAAKIFGVVQEEGMPVSFAIVTISEINSSYAKSTPAKQGKYEFTSLQPGKYIISVFSPRSSLFSSQELLITASQALQFDVILQEKVIVTTGTVSFETPWQRTKRKIKKAFLLPITKLKNHNA